MTQQDAFSFPRRVLHLLMRQLSYLSSLSLLRLPVVCLYYLYVWLPLFLFALFLKYALIVLQVSSRRSATFNKLIKHYLAFHILVIRILRKIRRSSLSELSEWVLDTIYEVVFTIFDESDEPIDVRNPLQFAELVRYHEVQEHDPQQRRRDKRMRHLMHHHVPSQPFQASVRVPSSNSGERSQEQDSSREESSLVAMTRQWLKEKRRSWLQGRKQGTDRDYTGGWGYNFGLGRYGGGRGTVDTCSASGLWSELESASRGSIPQSPNTLARVMNRSRDRVDAVVFFVRDKLRLEAQRESHDENSRDMASQLLSKGKFGVFDPYHTNKAIELTEGLHCASVRKSHQGENGSNGQSSLPSPSKPKKNRDDGRDSGERRTDRINPIRRSNGSLGSIHSSLSDSLQPKIYSTRAAIPLMQDVFVYFEYFIKSTSQGLGSGCGNLCSFPIVSLGLASCDFSLDSMVTACEGRLFSVDSCAQVGDDDRSIGLGLFPEHCFNPCRLYISEGKTPSLSHHPHHHPHHDHDNDNEAHTEKSTFEMLGGTASSGDRVGMLVYVCGGQAGSSEQGSFGRDSSTDCLSARQRNNSLESEEGMESPHGQRDSDFAYDYFDSDVLDSDDLLQSSSPEDLMQSGDVLPESEEEEGMHVVFNLNGCLLNVPWRAVSKISEIAWGKSALYPTVSFSVPVHASSRDDSTTRNSDAGLDESTSSVHTREGCLSSAFQNNVKIWGGFCVDDVVYRSRESIGAPPGVCVYCLDGSILIKENEP